MEKADTKKLSVCLRTVGQKCKQTQLVVM